MKSSLNKLYDICGVAQMLTFPEILLLSVADVIWPYELTRFRQPADLRLAAVGGWTSDSGSDMRLDADFECCIRNGEREREKR